MKTQKIMGVNISVIDRPGLLSFIDQCVQENRVALINNVNAHAMNIAYLNKQFRDVLNRSSIVFCDGYGVKLLSMLLGRRVGERMTPPDWIDELFDLCESKGYRVFFVGDEEYVIEAFVKTVTEKHPSLIISGYRNGFFPLGDVADRELVERIRNEKPDIIVTGMGMPRQEIWAEMISGCVEQGTFIATGAMFRWYSGFEKRAPRWITDHGFEWLARFCAHPRRNFKRYIIGIPLFMLRGAVSRIRDA